MAYHGCSRRVKQSGANPAEDALTKEELVILGAETSEHESERQSESSGTDDDPRANDVDQGTREESRRELEEDLETAYL